MKKLSLLLALCSLVFFTNCNDEPLEDDFPDESTLNCATTTENVVTAATNFLNATSDNYSELCNAYKAALQAQISACGDSAGAIQEIIDSLGDCTQEVDTCDMAETIADEAEFAFNNATNENYETLCMAYRVALENQIAACGDADGSLQNAIVALGDCTLDADPCDAAQIAATEAQTAFNNATSENYEMLCMAYKTALENQIAACGDTDGSIQNAIDALGDCTQDVDPCDVAQTAAEEAQIAFSNATDENYEALCMAYKTALENQIAACGDTDGSIQNAIDALGDCTQAQLDVEITVTVGTLDLEFDMVEVVEDGPILKVSGTSTSNTFMIYFEVEDLLTGVDIIENFVLTTTSDFFQSDQGPEPFTSNITINSQGVLQGTFSGLVTNAENANLSLTSGVIDINF